MVMDAELRRRLRSEANRLKSRVTIGKAGVTEAAIATIRARLSATELVKVRLAMADLAEADAAAEEIARRVPCELVGRVGYVGIFYRPRDSSPSTDI